MKLSIPMNVPKIKIRSDRFGVGGAFVSLVSVSDRGRSSGDSSEATAMVLNSGMHRNRRPAQDEDEDEIKFKVGVGGAEKLHLTLGPVLAG